MLEKYLQLIKSSTDKKEKVINILKENGIEYNKNNKFNIIDNIIKFNLDSKNNFIFNLKKEIIINSLKEIELYIKQ